MAGLLVLGILLLVVPLVVSIVVITRFWELKSLIEDLRRRVAELEAQTETPTPPPPSPKRAVPPPLPDFLRPPPAPTLSSIPVARPVPRSINWESILGVKLFAWIGGLALFLGVVFFVKYAFENNWVTPLMRIVGGAIVGVGLVTLSVIPAVRRYRVPAQSLGATGILILYADVYGAYSFYSLISLTVATALMWIVTAVALILATKLVAQNMAWLGVIGGFLTPILFRTNYENPMVLFGYIGVLSCGFAAVGALKRWNYLILLAAVGSVFIEITWAAGFFGPAFPETARIVFLGIEAQFLAICMAERAAKSEANWSAGATALAGFAALAFCLVNIGSRPAYLGEILFSMLFLANVGLIAVAIALRSSKQWEPIAVMTGGGLALSWIAEWTAFRPMIEGNQPLFVMGWYITFFLLFAVTPYFCGIDRLWPWMISAAAGPLQFWFAYQLMQARFPNDYKGLLPLAFALPAATGVLYLVKREHVDLASGDSRLASQGAAVLAFASLVFPVQFQREWITLGWAIEGLALILLFRWIPNRRLRAVALIVLCAAFVRLALNPAVLQYHPRSHVPIWNWYLYAYGIAAFCFFAGGHWFGLPQEKGYERNAPPMLYSLGGVVLFLLVNIEIADYFSIGPTLTFSFSGNFARDMTYTIAWSLFAFGLLVFGIATKVRPVRLVAIVLLCVSFAKLFLHDLGSLNQLYRIGAFITVAIVAIIASFVYQRFLSPETNKL
jgi:uncharacterized membrane protein